MTAIDQPSPHAISPDASTCGRLRWTLGALLTLTLVATGCEEGADEPVAPASPEVATPVPQEAPPERDNPMPPGQAVPPSGPSAGAPAPSGPVGVPPSAGQPLAGQPPAAPADPATDSEVAAFAEAQAELASVRQELFQQVQAGGDAAQLQAQLQTKASEIVQESELDAQRFAEIARMAQGDPELATRIRDQMAQTGG